MRLFLTTALFVVLALAIVASLWILEFVDQPTAIDILLKALGVIGVLSFGMAIVALLFKKPKNSSGRGQGPQF